MPFIYSAEKTSADPDNLKLGYSAAKPLIVNQSELICQNWYFVTENNKESTVWQLNRIKNTTITHELDLTDI